jgi:hypothetical protein
MARPFSSDAAGDGIWARVLFEGGETSRSEVIPQVREQAHERSDTCTGRARRCLKEGRAGTVTGRIVIDFHLGFVKDFHLT